jgi:hypothetical protein
VSKTLLRYGRVYPEPSTWTQKHRRWLAAQQFPEPMSALIYADLIACVDGLTARKKALAERIGELATDPSWWPTVARLRAFRGVDTLTALAIHLELGADWARFEKPTRVESWLGLTPSRSQSGETDRHGAITKTGSMLARRMLVESDWQYAREPRIGVTLANRQEGQPDHILQISNRAQQRLHHLYTSMRARGKPHNVTRLATPSPSPTSRPPETTTATAPRPSSGRTSNTTKGAGRPCRIDQRRQTLRHRLHGAEVGRLLVHHPAVGAEVVLHVDHDQRRVGGVELLLERGHQRPGA